MGMANWVMGKMIDRFLAQSPEEKAAVFDTMATKFWEAATPAEIARISELLLPRFLESFLANATAEQKVEMVRSFVTSEDLQRHMAETLPGAMQSMVGSMSGEQKQEMAASILDPEHLAAMAKDMLPGLLESAIGSMSPEDLMKLMPSPMSGSGMPGPAMSGFGMPGFGMPGPSKQRPAAPEPDTRVDDEVPPWPDDPA